MQEDLVEKLNRQQRSRFIFANKLMLGLTLFGAAVQGLMVATGAPLQNGVKGFIGNGLVLACAALAFALSHGPYIRLAKHLLFGGLSLYISFICAILSAIDLLIFAPLGASVMITGAFLVYPRDEATRAGMMISALAFVSLLGRGLLNPPLPDQSPGVFVAYFCVAGFMLLFVTFFCRLLARDLGQAIEDSEQARRDAQSASLAKSAFLANMSHELRTPLNAIIGYVELVQEEAQDHSPLELEHDLGRIHTSAQHLLTLISGVLDLAKIEAGKMEVYIEPVLIQELASELEAIGQSLAKEKDNTLKIEIDALPEPLHWHTDRLKLRQIVLNLLSNAAKFTQGGQITLKLRLLEPKLLELEVRDTGVGMAPEQVARVFEAFEQASHTTSAHYGGTGLGLTITRHFCEILDAKLQIESAPGEGTCFTITLPDQAPA